MSDKVSDERLREYAASFNNPDVRALAAELLALRAQQQAAGWLVKPLEWTGKDYISNCKHAFPSIGPCYTVKTDGTGKWWRGLTPIDGTVYLSDSGEAGATAAAQSDYAARINSAIEPAPVAEDGWIMHGGVVDPDLDGNTNVQVRFADGDTANGAVHDWDQNWQWSPGEPFAAGMIVAYRPISASGRDGE